jgi:hypothetical protein
MQHQFVKRVSQFLTKKSSDAIRKLFFMCIIRFDLRLLRTITFRFNSLEIVDSDMPINAAISFLFFPAFFNISIKYLCAWLSYL